MRRTDSTVSDAITARRSGMHGTVKLKHIRLVLALDKMSTTEAGIEHGAGGLYAPPPYF